MQHGKQNETTPKKTRKHEQPENKLVPGEMSGSSIPVQIQVCSAFSGFVLAQNLGVLTYTGPAQREWSSETYGMSSEMPKDV